MKFFINFSNSCPPTLLPYHSVGKQGMIVSKTSWQEKGNHKSVEELCGLSMMDGLVGKSLMDPIHQ